MSIYIPFTNIQNDHLEGPQGGAVIVIGATNLLDSIDSALRRPGRFDHEVTIKPPTTNQRVAILTALLSRWQGPFNGYVTEANVNERAIRDNNNNNNNNKNSNSKPNNNSNNNGDNSNNNDENNNDSTTTISTSSNNANINNSSNNNNINNSSNNNNNNNNNIASNAAKCTVDLQAVAAECVGFVGADLEALVREAIVACGRRLQNQHDLLSTILTTPADLTRTDFNTALRAVGEAAGRCCDNIHLLVVY